MDNSEFGINLSIENKAKLINLAIALKLNMLSNTITYNNGVVISQDESNIDRMMSFVRLMNQTNNIDGDMYDEMIN